MLNSPDLTSREIASMRSSRDSEIIQFTPAAGAPTFSGEWQTRARAHLPRIEKDALTARVFSVFLNSAAVHEFTAVAA